MHLDYNEFYTLKKNIKNVFTFLFEKINDFKGIVNKNTSMLDAASKKVLENIMNNPLKERLEKIFIFRKHHYKFK
jgi:hypothetical protein